MSHSIPTSQAATAALRPTAHQAYVQRLYCDLPNLLTEPALTQEQSIREAQVDALCDIFLGEKLPCSIGYEDMQKDGGYDVIILANRKITKTLLRRIVALRFYLVPVDETRVGQWTGDCRSEYSLAPLLEDGHWNTAAAILSAMHRQMTAAVGRRSL